MKGVDRPPAIEDRARYYANATISIVAVFESHFGSAAATEIA
jgi:hypothetical protein